MFELSKKNDKYVPKNRWIASLSNGETIFDDTRKLKSAWERLSDYVKTNNLDITQLRAEIGGLTVKLPKGQEGYIQKKKAWATGATSGICLCIGYVQGNRALIHELGEDKSSVTKYTDNPEAPWVIYKRSLRKEKHIISL